MCRSRLIGVPAHKVDDRVWKTVKPYIEQVLKRMDGKYLAEDVLAAIKLRHMQLWLVPGGVWVTTILSYPRKRILELVMVAGQYEDWLDRLEELKEYAKQQECASIEIYGRIGWKRKAKLPVAYTAYKVDV